MFKKVETLKELEQFETIYESTCKELGIKSDPYLTPCHRFLIMDGEDAIGTVEIVPKNSQFSIVGNYFNFNNHPLLNEEEDGIYEIGKIGIIPEKRGRWHTVKIVALLYDFILKHNAKQYVAVINKDFYDLIALQFKVTLERVGEDIHTGNQVVAIPIIQDCNKIIEILESNGFGKRRETILA